MEESLDRFQGKKLYSVDGKSFVQTKEGQMAVVEAIEFLRIQKPLGALKWCDELALAAADHANDIGPKGLVSTIGTDRSMPPDRIQRYG